MTEYINEFMSQWSEAESDLPHASEDGAQLNPAKEAKIIDLAGGSEEDMVSLRNSTGAQMQAYQNGKIDVILPEDSKLRAFFSNPQNMAISGNEATLFQKMSDGVSEGISAIPSPANVMANLAVSPRATKAGFAAGQKNVEIGNIGHRAIFDKTILTSKELAKAELEYKTHNAELEALGYNESTIVGIAGSSSEIAGQVVSNIYGGETGAMAAAGAMGVGTLGLAMMATGAALPLATVGGAVSTGFGVGFQVGMTADAFKVESGHAMIEFSKIRDINDNPLPDDQVKAMALTVGAINAGIEGTLIFTGMKMLGQITPAGRAAALAAKKATTAAASKLMLSTTFRAALGKVLLKFGKGIAFETTGELLQEIVPMVTEEIAKANANAKGTHFFKNVKGFTDAYGVLDEKNRSILTGIARKTILGSFGIGAPSASFALARKMRQANQAKTIKKVGDDFHKQVHSSETVKRSPEVMERMVRHIPTMDQQFTISPEDAAAILDQDPDALEKLGFTTEDVTKAIEAKEDLTFDKATMYVRLYNEDQYQLVSNKVSTDVTGMTAEMADNIDVTTELKNVADVVTVINNQESSFNKGMEKITKSIAKIADKKGWDNDYASTVAQTVESFALRNGITEKQDLGDFVNRLNIEDMTDQVVFPESGKENTQVAGRTEVRDRDYFVKVFEGANMSTIAHELGHVFLTETEFLTKQDGASTRIKNDNAILKKWFNSKKNKNVDSQELFARSFEQYLKSGKAPTTELRPAFKRYQEWMKAVYKTNKDLAQQAGFELNLKPEVAAVFDRMLATDQQIDQAAMDIDIVLDADEIKKLGLTKIEEAQLQTSLDGMLTNAKQKLQWEKEKFHAKRVQGYVKDAEAALAQEEFKKTKVALKETPVDNKMLTEMVGKTQAARFNQKRFGIVKNDTNYSPEQAAADNGYLSAQDMIEDIIAQPSDGKYVNDYVQDQIDKYDGSITEAQDRVLQERMSDEYMQAVGKVLARDAGVVSDNRSTRALKQWADREIGNSTNSDAINPTKFLNDFKRAMRNKKDALTKGDVPKALEFLQKGRQDMAKHNSAKKAKIFVEQKAKAMKKLGLKFTPRKTKPAQKIQPDFLIRGLSLLQQFSFISTTKKYATPRPLTEVIAEKYGKADDVPYSFPVTPPELSDNLANAEVGTSYLKGIKYNDFRQIVSRAKWLFDMGVKLEDGQMSELPGKKQDYLDKLIGVLDTQSDKGDLFAEGSIAANLTRKGREGMAYGMIPEFMWRAFDGYKLGAHMSTIWNPINKQDNKAKRHEDGVKAKLRPIMEYFYKRKKTYNRVLTTENTGATIPPVPSEMKRAGRSWTYERIIAIAFNQGTKYNQQSTREGFNLSQDQVDEMMKVLTEEDWDKVEEVWALVDSQWDLVSGAYRKMNVLDPVKVKADEYKTPSGKVLSGGYYPVKFDSILNDIVGKRDKAFDLFNSTYGVFGGVTPPAGFVQAREGSGGLAVDLSFRVLGSHLKFTTHYGYVAPILQDIDQITKDADYHERVVSKFSKEQYGLIKPWLRKIAVGDADPTANDWDWLVNKGRLAATAYALGYSTTVAAKQVLSFINFIQNFANESGVGYAKAIGYSLDYYFDPIANKQFMTEVSSLMRHRFESIDDSLETLGNLDTFTTGQKVLVGAQKAPFAMIGVMDMLASAPAWHAAYKQGQKLHPNSQADAVQYADNFVTFTQPSTRVQDRSAFQSEKRGLAPMFNMFKGWTLRHTNHVIYNFAGAVKGKIPVGQTLQFVALNMIMSQVIASVLIPAAKGNEPPEIDEVALDTVLYNLSGVPILGDALSFIVRKIQGKKVRGIVQTPVQIGLVKITELGSNLMEAVSEADIKKAAWEIAEFGSFAYRVSVTKLYKEVLERYKQMKEDDNALRLVFRK